MGSCADHQEYSSYYFLYPEYTANLLCHFGFSILQTTVHSFSHLNPLPNEGSSNTVLAPFQHLAVLNLGAVADPRPWNACQDLSSSARHSPSSDKQINQLLLSSPPFQSLPARTRFHGTPANSSVSLAIYGQCVGSSLGKTPARYQTISP